MDNALNSAYSCFHVLLHITTLSTIEHTSKQEQQRVAVGPGNAHCMSIRQVLLRRAAAAELLLMLLVYSLIINY